MGEIDNKTDKKVYNYKSHYKLRGKKCSAIKTHYMRDLFYHGD